VGIAPSVGAGPLIALVVLVAAGAGFSLVRSSAGPGPPGLTGTGLAGVLGRIEGLTMAGLAIGAFAVAPATQVVGIGGSIVLTAAALPVVVLVAWRRLQAIDIASVVPVREIALLRRTALFAPLPTPTLEAVARQLVPVRAAAGDAIIGEGERRPLVLVSRARSRSTMAADDADPRPRRRVR
jgi:hypothetical protein